MHETQTVAGSVAVVSGTDDRAVRKAAKELARELSLPLLNRKDTQRARYGFLLLVGTCRLELWAIGRVSSGPIYVDLLGATARHRLRSSRDRGQLLARAVALRSGPPTVVDATAGLARDTFLLACLGCKVVAIERSPVLGAVVRDGLRRARAGGDTDLRAVVDRMELVVADARDVLRRMSGAAAPDIVYLDPMYPPRKKTALPKKEMRLLRRLVGDDPDAASLVNVARSVARKRVVVKRHRLAPVLAPRPAIQYIGKQVRYDVYHPAS